MPNRRTNRRRARRHVKSTSSKPVPSDVVKLIKKLNADNCSIALKQFLVYSLEKQVYGPDCTNEFILFLLSSYFILKNYYDTFSQIFNYPPRELLEEECLDEFKFLPGIQGNVLELIKVKTEFEIPFVRKCTMVLDEIVLKPEVIYNENHDCLIGFEDNGKVKSDKKAKYVTNIWIQCVGGEWMTPFAYFFTNESCSPVVLKEYLYEAISKLDGIGLDIVCVVTKMRTNFYELSQLLDISPTNQTFSVGNKEIVFLFDVPQLMNITRNNLMKYSLKFDEMQTSWKDIETFFNKESECKDEKKTKLTIKHIKPNKNQRLNPKLAVELLSNSVATEMKSFISLGKMPESATGTAECLDLFDKIFDIMNSLSEISLNEYCNAYKGTKHQVKFMQKIISFFENLKICDNSDRDCTADVKFIKGWLISVKGMMKIWDNLNKEKYPFLLTRNLNCEALDNVVWLLRWQIFTFRDPTADTFLEMYRKFFISSYFAEPSEIHVYRFDVNDFVTKVYDRIPPVKHDLVTGEYKKTVQKVAQKSESQSTEKEPSDQPSISHEESASSVDSVFMFGDFMKEILDIF